MLKRVIAYLFAGFVILLPLNAAAAHPAHKGAKSVSPFLITSGLPHYTMILKKRWDDPKLALTPEQKSKLIQIRKATIGSVMSLKPKIIKLRKKIVKAAMSGAAPESLSADVQELARLKAEATRTHLKCIYDTRQVLTPRQLAYLKRTLHKK
ncbi:Spy/CpxP family protein refolding chaperone [Hydrogenimonas sp.]